MRGSGLMKPGPTAMAHVISPDKLRKLKGRRANGEIRSSYKLYLLVPILASGNLSYLFYGSTIVTPS